MQWHDRLGCRKNDFPIAVKIAGKIFRLPAHPRPL
jgi:hypothetical protein